MDVAFCIRGAAIENPALLLVPVHRYPIPQDGQGGPDALTYTGIVIDGSSTK